jgi:hypothetical protein
MEGNTQKRGSFGEFIFSFAYGVSSALFKNGHPATLLVFYDCKVIPT